MKLIFLALISALGANTCAAQFTMPRPECTVLGPIDTGRTCNDLRQRNPGVCKEGEPKLTKIKFTKLQICNNGGVSYSDADLTKSRLVLRGPAIPGTTAITFLVKDMVSENRPNCLTVQSPEIEVDTCQPEFLGEFIAVDKNSGEEYSFVNRNDSFVGNDGQFMKRNCSLKTEVTCTTPGGQSCRELNRDSCQNDDVTNGLFTYEYCFWTDFTEHRIKIRNEYTKASRPPTCPADSTEKKCTIETHMFFNETFINDQVGFPGTEYIEPGTGKTCFKVFKTFEACEEPLPMARFNVVGNVAKVVNPNPDTVHHKRFKNCFSNNFVPEVFIINRDDSGPGGPGGPTTGGPGGPGGPTTGGPGGPGGPTTGGPGGPGSGTPGTGPDGPPGPTPAPTPAPAPPSDDLDWCAEGPTNPPTAAPTSSSKGKGKGGKLCKSRNPSKGKGDRRVRTRRSRY